MEAQKSFGGYLRYGKKLANSGASGVREASSAYLNGRPLCVALGEQARSSLPFAAIGLGAGVLQLMVGNRRGRVPRSLVVGAVGAAVGFFAGFSWKTRELTGSMAQGAMRNIGVARDERWLERHPIDYA